MEEPDVGRCVWMEDEPDMFDLRCNLVEDLQPFATNRVLVIGESSGVTPGLFKTGYKATADRVADKHEDDGYAAGFLPQNLRYLVAAAYDHVRHLADQFFCERPRLFGATASQAIVDPNIIALDPPQPPEALAQRR